MINHECLLQYECIKLRKGFKLSFWKITLMTTLIAFLLGMMEGIVSFEGNALGELFFALFLTPLITSPLYMGSMLVCLERLNSQPFRFTTVFKPYDKIWKLLLFTYSIWLLVIIAFLPVFLIAGLFYWSGLFVTGTIIAGIVSVFSIIAFTCASFFALPLFYIKGLTIIEAFKESYRTFLKNFSFLASYLTIASAQIISSALLLFIPLIWILPKYGLAYAMLYKQFFEDSENLES